jgi:hypothetical protein
VADHETTSKLILQGDPSGLISTMERAEAQVKRFNGMMDSASSTLGKFTGVMAVVTGALAGGAMFKAAADETLRWTGEAVKLSRQLGITTEEASVLNLAAGDVYLSMDVLSTAANGLTKTSMKNKEAFEHYGIALKDSNGHQRSTLEIMQEVNAEILSHAEGREREMVGLQLYGRSWDQVRGIIRLTRDGMEEAQRKAEDLHLIVGPEAVAKSKAYKAAMNDVEDILMSLKIQVGNHLLPILTNLGVWFNDIGPTALFLFEGALKGIMTLVHSATLGVLIFWEMWKAVWSQFSTSAVALVKIITQIISGDFSGAWDTAKQGWADFNQAGATALDNIFAKALATNDQLQRLFNMKPPKQRKEAAPPPEPTTAPYEKDAADKTAKLLGLEDAKLSTLLQGYQQRAQAIRSGNSVLIAEEEFYLRTGLMGQSEYNEKKYELERQALINTSGLLDDEIKEIEAAKQRKLALASDETDRSKIIEKAQQESSAKVAEKERLNSDLYLLDLKYFTDSTVLEETRLSTLESSQAKWKQKRDADAAKDQDSTREFFAEVEALSGSGMNAALLRVDQEREAWMQSWAMQAETMEQFENRKTQIETLMAQKRLRIRQDEEQRKLAVFANGLNVMASGADSFYQLSSKKSKAAFLVYQTMKSGELLVTGFSAAQKAFDIGLKETNSWYGGAAYAAASALFTATQLTGLWSQSADGGKDSGGSSIPDVSGASSASAAGVTQPTSGATATQAAGPVINLHIYGNVVDHDKFSRELIPSLQLALADGAHNG